MKKKLLVGMVLGASFLMQHYTYGQEEQESADVYLEEYTDEFQENFFEALKQKGIQNYDRAVDLFLKCKQLEPNNSVVDYELAKAYMLDKRYVQAQDFAIEALLSEPEDYWYLDNVLTILDKQGSPLETIKARIPYSNTKLRQNMALFYFKMRQYKEATEVLQDLPSSSLKSELSRKIKDSLQKRESIEEVTPIVQNVEETKSDPISQLKKTMEEYIAASNYTALLTESKEALDTYPLQPYFYYAYGTALNNTGNASKGVEVLESGLDYILDDSTLQNMIYRQLSEGYSKIGNTQKANDYLNKINSGL
ncbi:tetratricopeptide repeat protein [Flagellimonas marinaquae]